MNFTRNKMILYMLIIASEIDFILPWPIFQPKHGSDVQVLQPSSLSETRFSRQVVQPTWLNDEKDAPIDSTVYVNEQALGEAEEIRKTIQKAVEENTFVVANGQDPDMEFNPPTEPRIPPSAFPALPNWYEQMQKLWQDWAQSLFKGFNSQKNGFSEYMSTYRWLN